MYSNLVANKQKLSHPKLKKGSRSLFTRGENEKKNKKKSAIRVFCTYRGRKERARRKDYSGKP
jgi:hypothetical protein